MTAPGSAIPPSPGWWPRTNRVGTIEAEYGWEQSLTGLMLPEGTITAEYGWEPALTGLKPVVEHSHTGAGNYSATGAPSWSHVASPGDYVVVAVIAYWIGAITGVTYGGNAMTPLVSKYLDNNSTYGATALFGYTDTAGGTRTVAVTRSGTNSAAGNSTSYSRVLSVGATSSTSGSGTSLSHAVTGVTAERKVVHAFGCDYSLTATGGGTSRYTGGGSNAYLNISDHIANVTFTGTQSSSSPWAGVSVILSPAV